MTVYKRPKPSKYKNVKTEVDGITFDSKAESRRYQQLKLLESAGLISDLNLQPSFQILLDGIKICKYIADFEYMEKGARVIEDVKGMKTPVYNLKKKLVEAQFKIKIIEIMGK